MWVLRAEHSTREKKAGCPSESCTSSPPRLHPSSVQQKLLSHSAGKAASRVGGWHGDKILFLGGVLCQNLRIVISSDKHPWKGWGRILLAPAHPWAELGHFPLGYWSQQPSLRLNLNFHVQHCLILWLEPKDAPGPGRVCIFPNVFPAPLEPNQHSLPGQFSLLSTALNQKFWLGHPYLSTLGKCDKRGSGMLVKLRNYLFGYLGQQRTDKISPYGTFLQELLIKNVFPVTASFHPLQNNEWICSHMRERDLDSLFSLIKLKKKKVFWQLFLHLQVHPENETNVEFNKCHRLAQGWGRGGDGTLLHE